MLNLPTFDELKSIPVPASMTAPKARSFSVIASAPDTRKVKAAGYARVSTAHEDQQSSITIQRQHFLSQAAGHTDWQFVGIYCDIVSGTKKEKRPELQRLLADCRNGRVNLVLTKSISRFARNTTDLLEMVRSLSALGVGIVFDRENIDTRTMDSEFLLTILASLAEDESHSISSNCRWGIQKRFQDGTYRMSTASYGYDVKDGNLVINEGEAEVVREIFDTYLAGASLRSIANMLNDRGIPTKREGEVWKNGSRVSGKWDTSSIRDILDSVTYTGDMLLQKTYKDRKFNTHRNEGQYPFFYAENHHPPIIDHSTYEAVKEMREERRKHARKVGLVKHTFTSVLTCGCCGASLNRQKNRCGNVYWICAEHRQKADRCPLPPIAEKTIQDAFIAAMMSLHRDDAPIRSYQAVVVSEWRQGQGEKLTILEQKRDDAQKKLKNLEALRGQTQGYQEKRNKLRLELMEIEAELENMKEKRISLIEELHQSVHGWNGSSLFNPDTFHRLIEGVTVKGKEDIIFHFRCGLNVPEDVKEAMRTA